MTEFGTHPPHNEVIPKEKWFAGGGQYYLFPVPFLKKLHSEENALKLDNSFLPKFVERIEECGGTMTLREPIIDPSLPTLWAVIGPSGAGKSSVLRVLQETYPSVHVLKTASSRPDRASEAEKQYYELPTPLPGETRDDYNLRVGLEQFGLLDDSWYGGHIYGLPTSELARLADGQIPVVGTASQSLWQLERSLKDRYNVVSVGIVPRTYEEIIDVIAAERGDPDEQSYRASRAHIDTAAIAREANYAILNPRADSINVAVKSMAELISHSRVTDEAHN